MLERRKRLSGLFQHRNHVSSSPPIHSGRAPIFVAVHVIVSGRLVVLTISLDQGEATADIVRSQNRRLGERCSLFLDTGPRDIDGEQFAACGSQKKDMGSSFFLPNNIFVRKPKILLEIVSGQKTVPRSVSEPYHDSAVHSIH